MIIAVDFDGTVVRHEYPEIGADVPGAVLVLRELVAAGHQLILLTIHGARLDAHQVVGRAGVPTGPRPGSESTSGS